MFDLSQKVVVVTGALGLLGKEHCRALASHGAKVVATDIDAAATASFAEELAREFAVETLGLAADIADETSVKALHDVVLSRFGRADVLVNNAAIDDKADRARPNVEATKFENYSVEAFRRILDVNVTGQFLMCRTFGAAMAARGSGSIVNVASTYGLVPPDQSIYVRPDGSRLMYKSPAYPVSKGAVVQLTRFVAAYWGEVGVRCNTLCPGGVQTPNTEPFFVENYSRRTMMKRMANPTDYKGALVFLASDESKYVTGATLVVDGGWTAW